ncbi:GNAT family N-acetyltransferase [Candidatus Woesearchaeota archaeon]|nr:GNAT family N-acetyltransferase [Candidatus Woesearchaeota archaeon]
MNLTNIISIIPQDEQQEKRVRNLRSASRIYTRKKGTEVQGVVFVNRLFFFLPNITWITSPKHRKKGVATALIEEAKKDFFILTAKTKNDASHHLAKKSGFKELFSHHWIWFRHLK